MVDGTSRTYYAYLPSSVAATKPAPFLFVMHGATQNGNDMITITGYESVADSEGIAVAFLDGENTNSMTSASTLDPWNVSDNGAAVCGAGDLANSATAKVDFDFLDAVKADVAQDQCLDTAHIFATGFSMGGYFTHHIGCDRTDIRAIGPASGSTIASLSACATGHMQSSSSTAPRTRSSPRAVTTPTVLPSRASRRRQRSGRRRTAARRPTRRLRERHRKQRRPVLPLQRLPQRRTGRALHIHEHGARLGRRHELSGLRN